jgi:hypothetical protein
VKVVPAIALTVCLLLPLAARPVVATDCMQTTPQERAKWATAIVSGVVTGVNESVIIRSPKTIRMPETGVPHTVQVERIYKGEVGSEVTVYQTGILGAPHLQVGDHWLLFLDVDKFGHLRAGPCVPSTKVGPGGLLPTELAAALGPGWAPGGTAAVSQGRGQIAWWVVSIGVVVAGAGLYLLWLFKPQRQR